MSNSKILIRGAELSDLPEMQNLFVDTIRTICKNDYSKKQIDAWTSSIKNTERWINKLTTQYFLVAQLGNKIVGYASLESNDYFDFLYVHKDYQKQGIAGLLYSEIEKEAIKREAKIIRSDVSKTARPFFEKKGFITTEIQANKIEEVEILNYKMIKIF